MLEVVADAVHRLGRDEWWSTVRIALDDMTAAGARAIRQRARGWMVYRRTASMTDEASFLRGDIWTVDFGVDSLDPEQAFSRPALIVSDHRLHHPNLRLVIVIPGTSNLRHFPLHMMVEPDADNGLESETAFQVEQVRAVSVGRLSERLGQLDTVSRDSIDEILRRVLSL